MAERPATAEVVIAGAGVAGIATAFALSERGVRDVVLVDPRPPLSLTSRRPEANHRAWWPQPAMVALATRSIERVEALRADGARIPMDWRGYLYVSDDPGTAASLPARVAAHPARDAAQAEALGESELRHRWPHLGPAVVGAILVRRAGGLDAVALGEAMLDRAVARGVRLVRGSVSAVATRGGRIEGVRIAADRASDAEGSAILADVVVDATGPFAAEVARLTGASLPLETVLRQKVVIADTDGVVPRDAPFTITLDGRTLPWPEADRGQLARDPDGALLLGPLPGGIHVKPDDTAGPDAIKVGWAWDQRPSPPTDRPAMPAAFARMVLLGASTVIPGLRRHAEAVSLDGHGPVLAHEGGLYARTPDGLPLIGPVGGGPQGLLTVSGLAGFGAMMAAAAGELAAEWITRTPSGASGGLELDEPERAAFDPRRFEDAAYLAQILRGSIPTGEL